MRSARAALVVAAAGLALAAPLPGCKGPVDPEARRQLLERLGRTSVTVYPTLLRTTEKRYDADSAAALTDFLKAEKLADATLSDQRPEVTGEWGMNQSRMFRDSAEALLHHVRANPIQTDYALMAEYLVGSKEVVGIHAYVVDADNRLALGVQFNSHHKLFAEARPATVEDCTQVLISALREKLESALGPQQPQRAPEPLED